MSSVKWLKMHLGASAAARGAAFHMETQYTLCGHHRRRKQCERTRLSTRLHLECTRSLVVKAKVKTVAFRALKRAALRTSLGLIMIHVLISINQRGGSTSWRAIRTSYLSISLCSGSISLAPCREQINSRRRDAIAASGSGSCVERARPRHHADTLR